MNAEALIEEIKTNLSKYSDAGLLDENAMYRDIVLGLKRFGNDICTLHETVVEVKNGIAKLPDNFFTLYIAYLCEPAGYSKSPDIETHHLQKSLMYKERTTHSSKWNECDPCCKEEEENIIKENIYFNSGSVEFYYHKPQLLRLGKTFVKNACHSKCRNKLVRDNPNEIVIRNQTLQANFNEGYIYIQYYGFPTDEGGDIDIPDTPNGHLERFLESTLKVGIFVRLLENGDAGPNIGSLLSYHQNQEQISLRNASNELKMGHLTPEALYRVAKQNKIDTLKYEIGRRWS